MLRPLLATPVALIALVVPALPALSAQLAARQRDPADPSLERAQSESTPLPGAQGVTSEARARYREYFSIADYDGNGWVSFREARESMSLDRLTYGGFDSDGDGRVRPEEFELRLQYLEARAGGVRPPRQSDGPVLLPTRNSEQLRNAFDVNADGALEEFEIDQLLATYRRRDVPTKIVIEKLDTNGSRKLELEELTALSQLLSATYTDPDDRVTPVAGARSLDELFGGLTERPTVDYQRTQHPPMIGGPVRPFRRLDLDSNGYVSLTELERLQRPQTLSVSNAAVLAALDTDEDGRLSASEFQRALE